MTIKTNLNGLNSTNIYNQNKKKVDNSLQKLATGSQLNKAKDDAAGLAISEKLLSQYNNLNTRSRNMQDSISLTQVADGALQSSTDVVGRMKELAQQSTNATMSSSDREAISAEFNTLKEQLNNSAFSTNFNGNKLIDGSFNLNSIDGANAKIIDASAAGLGINNLDVSNSANAAQAINALTTAQDTISSSRAQIGATYNSLETQISATNTTKINIESARSKITDTDYAKESMELMKSKILMNSAQAMMAQSNLQPQQVLQMLK